MASATRSHGDYSVGWICALPKEQSAATAMLDKRHPNLSKPLNDTNTYTLGSIGPHNVVIACLPKGQYGTNSAATVAALMIRTYPSIKICLMVGIGGGIPPKVRLGDVVVSTPGGQYPGVVQWDLGKAKAGGSFERVGALSNPPSSLLTALSKLETEHELWGSKIADFLSELEKKYPNLAKKYLKSDSLHDVLFRADYSHAYESPIDTEGPTGGTAEHSEEDEEESHADGLYRDKLNTALGGDVLCLEMEAAGLMNNFPCLVIRGICAYRDSHKNMVWQEHAAAVATAFAKELLGCIQPGEVEGERFIKDVMNDVKQDIQHVYTKVEEGFMDAKIDLISLRDANEAEKKREILKWLSPIDFAVQQNDYFSRCEPGTGQDFLKSEEVQNWLATSRQTLFCQGIPGAGKTFQTAILVNHLVERFQQYDTVELADILTTIIKPFSRMYILIYALDETDDDSSRTKFLDQLFIVQKKTGINLFATSRSIDEIAAKFKGCIFKDIHPSSDDVFKFLHARMWRLPAFVAGNERLQEEIKTSIKSTLGGIWQEITGSSPSILDEAYNKSMERIQQQKGDLSRDALLILSCIVNARRQLGLEELREAIAAEIGMSALNTDNIPTVEHIIQACAPLVTIDGNTVRLVHYTTQEYFERQKFEWMQKAHVRITDICMTYLSFSAFQDDPCFTWSSFQSRVRENPFYGYVVEYWGYHTHEALTQGLDASKMVEFLEHGLHRDLWYHLLPIGQMATINGDHHFDCLIWDYSNPIGDIPRQLTAVHIAAFFGLYDEVAKLLAEGYEPDIQDSLSRTPLWWATWSGHANVKFYSLYALMTAAVYGNKDIVELLLEKGANIEAQTLYNQTSLLFATEIGDASIIRLLLANGASLETKDFWNRTPLIMAIQRGLKNIIDLFIEHGADINMAIQQHFTPLTFAIMEGDKNILEFLIERGANLDARDGRHWTPLTIAIEGGNRDIVEVLVEKGADLEAKEGMRGTSPLIYAAWKGHREIVEYLVDKGANLGAKGHRERQTPVALASIRGYADIIRLLIEKGANIEAKDYHSRTPLCLAAMNGRGDAIELLLIYNANIEANDDTNKTPLILAAKYGKWEVLNLLARNANLEAQDIRGYTPLTWAVIKGHSRAIELLLQNNAKASYRDDCGRTLMHIAVKTGRLTVVLLLLRTDVVEVDERDSEGQTPLSYATKRNEESIVKALLDSGKVDADAKDNMGRTSLSYCTSPNTASLLLETKDVDVESRDKAGRTPMWYATRVKNKELVKLLLEHGAQDSSVAESIRHWIRNRGSKKD
ncbi:ankyrin repeat-containing domain protein [Trichoderma ceciliae]